MKEEKVKSYDAALVLKEKRIENARAILQYLIALVVLLNIYVLAQDIGYFRAHPQIWLSDDIFLPSAIFIVFLCALIHTNTVRLRHIASIKMYKKESQPGNQEVRAECR